MQIADYPLAGVAATARGFFRPCGAGFTPFTRILQAPAWGYHLAPAVAGFYAWSFHNHRDYDAYVSQGRKPGCPTACSGRS